MTTKAESGSDGAERIGAYRVVRRLATGGTSDVLLAKAEGPHGFERTVVLKVLLSHFGKDDDVAKMFAREASAYARLSHPAIVRLFDFFSEPATGLGGAQETSSKKKNGRLVMVLEYVDGPPLARLKSMAKAIGKEIDDKAAIYIAACIFDALAAAHSATDDMQIPAPVIHRDVNPSNVLVPWDGYPKLADFGVAKVTGLNHESVVGMIKGTYGYMAPEQVSGSEAVTPRSDVYAAAIILWELLTKRRAFQRGALPEAEALRAMAEPRLPALESIRGDVDRSVREAVRRALEPVAAKRKITSEEMVSILHGVVSPAEGRERLMALLGLVRNDARAASAVPSNHPPPMPGARRSDPLIPNAVIPGAPKLAPDFGPPATQQGLGTPSGAPPKAGPPRPRSSAKFPAVSPPGVLPPPVVPTTTLSSIGAPAPPPGNADATGPQPLPTRPAMPAVAAPPPVAPPPPPNRIASRPNLPAVGIGGGALPPPEGPPRTKSAAARLASSIPPQTVTEPPAERLSSILDDIEHAMSLPPDSPRAAPKDGTSSLGLRDAIDELMKSSQRGIPVAAPAGTPAPPLASHPPSDKPQMRETTRVPPHLASTLIGMIPAAPPPLSPAGLEPPTDSQPPNQNEVLTTPPSAVRSDYPSLTEETRDEEPRDATVVMEPLAPPPAPPPKFNATMVMEARPLPTSTSMPVSTSTSTPSAPPHLTPIPARPRSEPIPYPQYVGADPRPSSPAPPSRKGVGIGTVAIALVVLIGIGIAGTIGFVRYQASKEVTPPHPSAVVAIEPPVTSVVAPPATPPSAASSAPEPAVASAVPPPSAAPSASTAPASAEAVPEGMGLLKTPGTAPGRRIFVDDKVEGQTPSTLTVKCGKHKVKLGSSGVTQEIDVPCGGEISVADKF